MDAILGAALVIGMVAVACVGPFYYCKQSDEGRENKPEERSSAESPLIHIRITHPNRDTTSSTTSSENGRIPHESFRGSCEGGTNGVLRDATPIASERVRIVPPKPPRRRIHQKSSTTHESDARPLRPSDLTDARGPRRIWSSPMRSQLESIGSSSSLVRGSRKLVKAQVEVYPRSSMSTSNEAPGSLATKHESLLHGNVDSAGSAIRHDSTNTEKTGRLSAPAKKWKILKKSLILSRSEKSISVKDAGYDETQRLDIPVPVSWNRRRSPVGHSTMLQKGRLVDASTSTRISANLPSLKEPTNHEVIPRSGTKSNELVQSVESTAEQRFSSTEVLRDVASLLKRRSVTGQSTCDVKITGLSMNQSELLNLFEATNGNTKSASIVTTEEASIISIKFHRDRRSSTNAGLPTKSSSAECPLRRLYRNLPVRFEDMSLSKLFVSEEQSEGTDCTIESPRVHDRPQTMTVSTNESSYMEFPKVGEKVVVDESLVEGAKGFPKKLKRIKFWRFFRRERTKEKC